MLQFASLHVSSVTAVTGLQAGGTAVFWILRNVQTRCQTHPAFFSVVTGGCFIAGNATGT